MIQAVSESSNPNSNSGRRLEASAVWYAHEHIALRRDIPRESTIFVILVVAWPNLASTKQVTRPYWPVRLRTTMRKTSKPIPLRERFSDGVSHFLNYAGKITAYDCAIVAFGIESRPVRRVESNCFGANQDIVVPEFGG